jgi:hypothetical protein
VSEYSAGGCEQFHHRGHPSYKVGPALPSLVDLMCRNIPLVAVTNSTIEGIPVTR